MKTNQENKDRCARCGTAFVCGMKAGQARCWCADLPPLEPLPGRGCLCRACLEIELATELRRTGKRP
ncbi:MAG: cysteine-rich CWC family protein [Pseudomonadota bacterium]